MNIWGSERYSGSLSWAWCRIVYDRRDSIINVSGVVLHCKNGFIATTLGMVQEKSTILKVDGGGYCHI